MGGSGCTTLLNESASFTMARFSRSIRTHSTCPPSHLQKMAPVTLCICIILALLAIKDMARACDEHSKLLGVEGLAAHAKCNAVRSSLKRCDTSVPAWIISRSTSICPSRAAV